MRTPPGRRRAVVRTAAIAVLAVLTAGCSANAGGSPTATDRVVEQVPAGDRVRVERFTGTLLDGTAFDSADVAGRVVVYNVWGSWCAPCRTEAPALARVSGDTAAQDVRFVGINVRDNDAAARAFEASYGIAYPSLTTDTSSDALLAFGPSLPPSAVPSTLVVDADGRLAARVIGPVDASTLRALVDDALAEAGAAP
ncbi:TlpA disulfide reductase family protein [Nocardioides sp. L-11A]|uniref:TlpA family protein disulfide reductase n=1 Tax=Nocardioides sp. L-11A TaxID=3043848 RepID=UPI00249B6DA6|nr:TlpA disulfide reductase family protein [Nocardioides sp. L-11A]